jgi:hypothetical protein
VGDWDTEPGPLPVPTELAVQVVEAVRAADPERFGATAG